jgi:hypothetical protein
VLALAVPVKVVTGGGSKLFVTAYLQQHNNEKSKKEKWKINGVRHDYVFSS